MFTPIEYKEHGFYPPGRDDLLGQRSQLFPTRVIVRDGNSVVLDRVVTEAGFLGMASQLKMFRDTRKHNYNRSESISFDIPALSVLNLDAGDVNSGPGHIVKGPEDVMGVPGGIKETPAWIPPSHLPIRTIKRFDSTNPEHQSKPIIWLTRHFTSLYENGNYNDDGSIRLEERAWSSENDKEMYGSIYSSPDTYTVFYTEKFPFLYMFDDAQFANAFLMGAVQMGKIIDNDGNGSDMVPGVRNIVLPIYMCKLPGNTMNPLAYQLFKVKMDDVTKAALGQYLLLHSAFDYIIDRYYRALIHNFNEEVINKEWMDALYSATFEMQDLEEDDIEMFGDLPMDNPTEEQFRKLMDPKSYISRDVEKLFSEELHRWSRSNVMDAAWNYLRFTKGNPGDYTTEIILPDDHVINKKYKWKVRKQTIYIPPNCLYRWLQGIKLAAGLLGHTDAATRFPLYDANKQLVIYN